MKLKLFTLAPFSFHLLLLLAQQATATLNDTNVQVCQLVTAITSLNTQLHQPEVGTSLLGALHVSNAALALVRSLKGTTTYLVNNGQLTIEETTLVLNSMTRALPTVRSACTAVVDLKPQFEVSIPALASFGGTTASFLLLRALQAMHIDGIARSDVLQLQTAVKAFTQGIVDTVVAANVTDAMRSQVLYDTVLAHAASAYA
ncbi:hypothetical protein OC842_006165 [Tilletia horrida]|uniref:Cell wall galactomannoprotein n=1 Tax=Tilletia horrida TaxID=155126 RepID=A0AAN6G6F9_9BASI|nr:hypothetical protein OC842_006165 [Tilletia horrida]